MWHPLIQDTWSLHSQIIYKKKQIDHFHLQEKKKSIINLMMTAVVIQVGQFLGSVCAGLSKPHLFRTLWSISQKWRRGEGLVKFRLMYFNAYALLSFRKRKKQTNRKKKSRKKIINTLKETIRPMELSQKHRWPRNNTHNWLQKLRPALTKQDNLFRFHNKQKYNQKYQNSTSKTKTIQ